MNVESSLMKRLYFNLALSFLSALVLYFMLLGFYNLVNNFSPGINISYILLVFAISFIVSGVALEHRSSGTGSPYYLIGAGIIAGIFTFVFLCVINGLIDTINNGLPDYDLFIAYLSVLTAISFGVIKVFENRFLKTGY